MNKYLVTVLVLVALVLAAPVDAIIRTGTIIADNIAAGAITTAKLAAGAITADKIAAGTITGDKISAGTITADKLSVSNLAAVSANMGSITAGSITLNGGAFTLASNGDVSAADGEFTQLDVLDFLLAQDAQVTFDLTVGRDLIVDDLAGSGTRPVCATSAGLLVVCP